MTATTTLLGIIYGVSFIAAVHAADISSIRLQSDSLSLQDSLAMRKQVGNLRMLQADLRSGRPTLAFFYYSVACSCTAARCNIAAAAIDSVPALMEGNDSLNYVKIDAYLAPEGESLFSIVIVPAVVYFNEKGKEINRLEWGVSRDAIRTLIQHPELKQAPLE